VVERIVELDPGEYEDFRRDMLQDQDFIADFNSTIRGRGGGTIPCLLVLGQGCDDGVLIDSQGYDYARYVSFVPGARQLLAAEEQRAEQAFTEQIRQIEGADLLYAPAWTEHARALAESDAGAYGPAVHNDYIRSLRQLGDSFQRIGRQCPEPAAAFFNRGEFCRPDQLLPAADSIHDGGDREKYSRYARAGSFTLVGYAAEKIIEDGLNHDIVHHSYDDILETYGLDAGQMPQLLESLHGRAELEELLVHDNRAAFTLCFRPQYLGQYAPEQAQPPLHQEDLTAMYARHLLWELEQPDGVQADFSGRVLSGLDFEGMSFRGAVFAGASIHQCRMGQATFEGNDFTGAKLRGTAAYEVDFRDANFSGAILDFCTFDKASFDGCDFAGALVRSCDFNDVFTESADFTQARFMDCEGLDGIAQGQTMGGGMA
jgi:uncharacterized protein YjbI with pentapeptide repeats